MFLFSWFFKTAETFSAVILVLLISSMLSMACVVFQLDLVLDNLSNAHTKHTLNRLFSSVS